MKITIFNIRPIPTQARIIVIEAAAEHELSEFGESEAASSMDSDIPEDMNLDAAWDDVYDTGTSSSNQ